jgi:hypothetical protein
LYGVKDSIKHDYLKKFKTNKTVESEKSIIQIDGSEYAEKNNTLFKKQIKKSSVVNVSKDYQEFILKIIEVCKINKISCYFVTQPTAYSLDASKNLQERFWMTPPNANWTLSLTELIGVSNLYNDWLLKIAHENQVNACDLGNKIPPQVQYFYDDCHFNEGGAILVAKYISQCMIDASSGQK